MSADDRREALGLVPAILAGLALLGRGAPPMPDGERPEEGAADGPGYETSDVHVGNAGRVMAGLLLAAILAVGTMVWMRGHFAASQNRALPSLTPQQTTQLAPPAPNLQAKPYADIDRERAGESRRLAEYAYTDAAHARARIPIDRAMALMVGRALDP